MRKAEFIVPGEPVAKGRPRVVRHNGFTKTYTPEKTVLYENLVRWEYVNQTKGYKFPDDAQLHISIFAYFQIPKSASKRKREEMASGYIRPLKKPDLDNVLKCIADACNTVAYHDDSQIVGCTCSKFYSDNPRVEIIITEIGGETDAQ